MVNSLITCGAFTLIIWVTFAQNSQSYPNYTLTMTQDAYKILHIAYIDQLRNKTCQIHVGGSRTNCQLYCRLFYAYVPGLPQKNLAGFDKKTRKCIPKKYCPAYLGVFYDQKSDKCFDDINGKQIAPLQPKPPNPAQQRVINVTFYCKHGKVITFNGFPDCQCDLGYKTQIFKALAGQNQNIYQAIKCNEEAKLYEYFPSYFKVKYDPESDNRFPFAWDQDYWTKALSYYLRKMKYSIQNYFQPWEVQIFTIAIPQQDTIRQEDYIYFFWFLFGFAIVAFFSIYQKNVNGRAVQRTNYQQRIRQSSIDDISDSL